MKLISNTTIWILSLAAVLALYSSMASADDRFTKLEAAWNAKDTQLVQENFSRAGEDAALSAFASARLASEAEQGQTLTIRELKRLNQSAYGVNATLDGQPVTWVFFTCEDSPQFCGFIQRKGNRIPGIWKAAGVDAATTALAIGQGLAEGNPLGLIGATVIKGAIIANARTAPFDECVSSSAASQMVWNGAGVANMLTMLGAPMGVSLLGLLATAAYQYDGALETAVFDCAEYQFKG